MNECEQEMCPYWSGDGRVCPCAIWADGDWTPPKPISENG